MVAEKQLDRQTRNFLSADIAYPSMHGRPYHVKYIGSRPITEVKQRRAWLVLRWVTAWEHHVL